MERSVKWVGKKISDAVSGVWVEPKHIFRRAAALSIESPEIEVRF